MPSRPSFSLAIFEPPPSTRRLDAFDINPDITTLVYRTGLPGGFTSLDVGMPNENLPKMGVIPRGAIMQPQCRAVLYEGARVVFEGRLLNGVGPGARDGGQFVGYGLAGLNDGYVSSSDATSDTAGDILQTILSTAGPDLQPGGSQIWRDSGITHTLAEFNRRSPYAAVQQLSTEGGTGDLGNVTWDFGAWEDRQAFFLPRAQPLQPDYIIPYEGRPWVQWNEDYADMVSTAIVSYTVNDVETDTASATTDGFQNRWGFSRSVALTMGETTATAAASYRDTYLAVHSDIETSIVVQRTDDRGLELPGGGEYPAHLVRAGEWVQINIGDGTNPMFVIVGTEYDANSGVATYELGAPNRYAVSENMAAVCQETSYLARFLNPLTGTRTR